MFPVTPYELTHNDRFNDPPKSYYRSMNAVIVMYMTGDQYTFKNADKFIRRAKEKKLPVYLIENCVEDKSVKGGRNEKSRAVWNKLL